MSKTRLAIFEDDVVNRFLYQRLLERQSTRIDFTIFSDPKQGVEEARLAPFDVVFIEVHFWKNFGGIEILRHLQKVLPENTVYVAMSSLLQEGDVERMLKAGFTMCVEKPVVFADHAMMMKKAT